MFYMFLNLVNLQQKFIELKKSAEKILEKPEAPEKFRVNPRKIILG